MRTESKKPLDENNYKEQIKDFTQQDWRAKLTKFLTNIGTTKWGRSDVTEEVRDFFERLKAYVNK